MPTAKDGCKTKCPFWKEYYKKANGFPVIKCGNLISKGARFNHIDFVFKKEQDRKEWGEDYCECECYRGCVIYQALESEELDNDEPTKDKN